MDTKQIFSAQLQEAVKYSSINYSELAKKLGIKERNKRYFDKIYYR